MATFVIVQRGSWQGVERDILLESQTAAAFLTAARDYCAETKRAMPEIAEPEGGLRTVAETTEMQWAFDYGPKGRFAATASAAQRARSNELYLKYNMSRVSKARPSINGTHTTGFYFDVATLAFQNWLLINGHRYGLTRPLGDVDPNHWKFTPGTGTAALDVTSLDSTPEKEPPMTNDTRVLQMVDTNGGDISDWSRVGPDVLPVGTPGQPGYFPGGYEATADVNVARLWVTQYGLDAAGPIKREREAYIAQQQFGAKEYVAHQAALAKLIAANSAGSAPEKVDYAAVAKAVNDDAAARLAK